MAADLLSQVTPLQDLPTPQEIARRYQIPLPTAQFVRRTLSTLLRQARHIDAEVNAGAAVESTDDANTQVQQDEAAAPAYGANAKWPHVARNLRHRILTGQLRGRLPTQVELAVEYQVSIGTVRAATRQLAGEGLLQVQRRHGTWIPTPQPAASTTQLPQDS
ncbi:winged helix-turn-helix domain-containing protein [Streptomyces sp. N35]|uniref:winged helix-turn-helix domain-containing protein n=1 Tax=Streptomyces sp. N35 TaxID=2795730 RepID=UPI0027DE496F|nr:winged helix-turn-helix domain-containing protein [Streptomyces sp. N35]